MREGGDALMFSQDHSKDFDAMIKSTSPFALIRFGDGETALIDGVAHRSADKWSADEPVWCKDELYESLAADLDGFCLGLPPACCHSRGLKLRAVATAPRPRQTFSTLFLHGNLKRIAEFRQHFRTGVIVNDKPYADIKIPSDGVTKQWDVDAVVDELLTVRNPILLAAGPMANIIAFRYWKRQERHLRVPIIDVGSPLDVLHGNVTRHYHGTMDKHVCHWHERDRSAHAVVPKAMRMPEGRIRIGRVDPSDATPVQRQVDRIKIGKR